VADLAACSSYTGVGSFVRKAHAVDAALRDTSQPDLLG